MYATLQATSLRGVHVYGTVVSTGPSALRSAAINVFEPERQLETVPRSTT